MNTKIIIPEPIKISVFVIAIFLAYSFVQDDDYHMSVDKPHIVRYNCDMLLGSWHPDVPVKVIDECRKLKGMNVKSY